MFMTFAFKELNIKQLFSKRNQRLSIMWRFLVTLSALISVCRTQSSDRLNLLTDSLLQQFMNRLDNNQNIDDISYISRVSLKLETEMNSSDNCFLPLEPKPGSSR